MKDQKLKESVVKIKTYFVDMDKKKRTKVVILATLIVVGAVLLTLFLTARSSAYQVLYVGLEPTESTEVYQSLVGMGAKPKLNEAGEVMVPTKEYDVWILRLAAEGFPRSALTYEIYAQYSGMTATESDKQQWLIYQLQDRIQQTLKQMDGVNSSTVNITIPKNSDYVWKQAEEKKERPTAGVLLNLKSGVELTMDQVTTIKNLVASSVLDMQPKDVTVVDAQTSLELFGRGTEDDGSLSSSQNLDFERTVQDQIENNIERLLAPRYGEDGVVAVAKVTLNYDKMMTERMELQERPPDANGNGGGGGYLTDTEGSYGLNGEKTIGGIVGEENNTDIPSYPYVTPGDNTGTTQYDWKTHFDYPYIKTQIEKGNAILQRATISVMVDEPNLTPARQAELVSLISSGADIPPELIIVSAFDPTSAMQPTPTTPEPTAPTGTKIPFWVWIIAAVVLILLVFLIILLLKIRKKKKRASILMKQKEEEDARRLAQEEIDTYKKQLSEAAKTSTGSPKDDAILEEVRDFAKENPEITANLLRSWLREDD